MSSDQAKSRWWCKQCSAGGDLPDGYDVIPAQSIGYAQREHAQINPKCPAGPLGDVEWKYEGYEDEDKDEDKDEEQS